MRDGREKNTMRGRNKILLLTRWDRREKTDTK